MAAALELRGHGTPEFYGYLVAKQIRERGGSRLTAHGTMYKALERMEAAGLLTSRWEDDSTAEEGRPRRKLYTVTPVGEERLAEWQGTAQPTNARLSLRSVAP